MRPRRRRLGLVLLPWGLAAAVGAAFFVFLTPEAPAVEPEVLQAGGVEFTETSALERRWVDEAFPVEYLPSTPLELPCPTGTRAATPWSLRIADALSLAERGEIGDAVSELREIDRWDSSNWVPGLALGLVLLRAGREEEAATFLEDAAGRSLLRTRMRSAADAARRDRPHRGPLSEDVLGGIHVLHAFASSRLAVGRSGPDVVEALVKALAGARLLALRELDEKDLSGPAWLGLKLQAPGCRGTAESLTPLDLENDLIVAYLELEAGKIDRSTAEWRRESERDYREPPRANPLLAVLLRFAGEPARATEGRSWAVSESERLLRSLRGKPLQDAPLAANLASLTSSLSQEGPDDVRALLRTLADDLLTAAVSGREDARPREQRRLRRAVARLILHAAVDGSIVPELPTDVAAELDASERESARRVTAALALRTDSDALLSRLGGDDAEVRLELGGDASAWLSAARRDVARSLAVRGDEAPEEERSWWAKRARGVLGAEDEAPAELLALEGDAGADPPPGAEASAVAVLAAAVAWLAGAWGARQLASFSDLRTSFYRLEARRRLRGR